MAPPHPPHLPDGKQYWNGEAWVLAGAPQRGGPVATLRVVSGLAYLAALACLLLPMLTVTFGNGATRDLTGIHVALGNNGQGSSPNATGTTAHIDAGDVRALIAAALIAISGFVALFRDRHTRVLRGTAGFFIVGLMVWVMLDFDGGTAVVERVTVVARLGFWLIIGLSVVGLAAAAVEETAA